MNKIIVGSNFHLMSGKAKNDSSFAFKYKLRRSKKDKIIPFHSIQPFSVQGNFVNLPFCLIHVRGNQHKVRVYIYFIILEFFRDKTVLTKAITTKKLIQDCRLLAQTYRVQVRRYIKEISLIIPVHTSLAVQYNIKPN